MNLDVSPRPDDVATSKSVDEKAEDMSDAKAEKVKLLKKLAPFLVAGFIVFFIVTYSNDSTNSAGAIGSFVRWVGGAVWWVLEFIHGLFV